MIKIKKIPFDAEKFKQGMIGLCVCGYVVKYIGESPYITGKNSSMVIYPHTGHIYANMNRLNEDYPLIKNASFTNEGRYTYRELGNNKPDKQDIVYLIELKKPHYEFS
jgi:hypothetical protein